MVTIQDIAKESGVNKSTVSSVLNGKAKKARISEKTCAKVLAMAQKLGYKRNELARSVATGKSNVIAFVSWDTGVCEYIGKIISGILEELSDHDYSLKVFNLTYDNSREIAMQIIQQRIDGVIFHFSERSCFELLREEMHKNNIPCAVVNLTSKECEVGVTTNDFEGTRQAVKYLAELGHKRIMYISHELHNGNIEYIENRENGYRQGVKDYLKSEGQAEIVKVPARSKDKLDQIVALFNNAEADLPTAVMCINDVIAMKVMQIAYKAGIAIPEELSIVGFANLDTAKYAVMPLTTIAQPFRQMGSEAAKMLINILKGNKLGKAKNTKMEVKLIIRESTAAVK